MQYTYINMIKVGSNYYIVSYDYKGNKIDVSKPYKTKKACSDIYSKILKFSWIKEKKGM